MNAAYLLLRAAQFDRRTQRRSVPSAESPPKGGSLERRSDGRLARQAWDPESESRRVGGDREGRLPPMAATDETAGSAQTTGDKLRELERLRDAAEHSGSEKAVTRQREQGKLLARERVEKLLDPGSFFELDRYVRHRESSFGMLERRPYGDAVVTGYGTIFGRKVFVFSQDFTVFGGSLSEVFAEKM